jgi:hypothetical protein
MRRINELLYALFICQHLFFSHSSSFRHTGVHVLVEDEQAIVDLCSCLVLDMLVQLHILNLVGAALAEVLVEHLSVLGFLVVQELGQEGEQVAFGDVGGGLPDVKKKAVVGVPEVQSLNGVRVDFINLFA